MLATWRKLGEGEKGESATRRGGGRELGKGRGEALGGRGKGGKR